MSFTTTTSTKFIAGRTSLLTTPMSMKSKPRLSRSALMVNASQKNEFVGPMVAASVAASLAAPEFAMATTLTPTVEALLKSVVAGGIIAGLILGAVTLVAGFDPIRRK